MTYSTLHNAMTRAESTRLEPIVEAQFVVASM